MVTERNVVNSAAVYLAQCLLDLGYLVYWYGPDALQTPTRWYGEYTTKYSVYAADPGFVALLAGAKGMVTLHDGPAAFPRRVVRPTNEGKATPQSDVQVPVFGISVGEDVPLRPYEHGSTLKWRTRALHVDGRVRNQDEQRLLTEHFERWFDELVVFDVTDHDDAENTDIEAVTVLRRTVYRDVVLDAGEQDRFPLELYAQLEYVS